MSCKHILMFIGALTAVTLAGCNGAGISGGSPADPGPSPMGESRGEDSGGAPVALIVFVGKKEACDCTRKRIDVAWGVLREVLQGREGLTVKRIQMDVEEEEARGYTEMKPLMVPPGIYLLDQAGGLLEMLQGEVDRDQILAALD